MRTMIAIGAIALLGTTLNAQTRKTDPSTIDKTWVVLNTEQLNMQLGLDDTQQAKVKEIDTRYITKHEALEQAKLGEKEMSDQTAKLMMARDRDLRAVLTPEQYTKWDGMRQKGTVELTPEKKEEMK